MKAKSTSSFIISILIPLAAGSISSVLSGAMDETIFVQPAISPPSWIFPIVWTILYILMGISSYFIYISEDSHSENALKVYAVQLFFNFFWSILFFRFALYLPAFLWLIALIILICIMIALFYRINPVAAYLQIPYLLWCIFAAWLNFMIYKLN